MEGEHGSGRAMLVDFSALCGLAALWGLAASVLAGALVLLLA